LFDVDYQVEMIGEQGVSSSGDKVALPAQLIALYVFPKPQAS
jgi:hypothetical protein